MVAPTDVSKTSDDSTPQKEKIEFIDYHLPAIKDGHYSITLKQTVTGSGVSDEFSSATYHFSILGPRFTLSPDDIHAVFPPAGSLGEHSNVFPHIVFNRSTLPWERNVGSNDKDDDQIPWLALLLFDENEAPTSREESPDSSNKLDVITYAALKQSAQEGRIVPGFISDEPPTQTLDHDDDKITVIDVRWQTLKPIIPSLKDLKWLAYVRKTTDAAGHLIGEERAVIFGHRLPQPGRQSTVHLVSLEGFYSDQNPLNNSNTEINNDTLIRLVSLKRWRFACVSDKHTFKSLLTGLNQGTLRLPTHQNSDIDAYYKRGAVPTPHVMRQGNQSVSWYHGPLVPGTITQPAEITLPVRAGDDLTRYNPKIGMFDVSYSAAWELGRLIALQNKQFSIQLYHWKRTHAHQVRRFEDRITHAPAHLPHAHPTPVSGSIPVPPSISEWFNRLRFLQGIPFNYLVPDERMLPQESIRFFQIDPMWMECLLDGAFSIGRVTTSDYDSDCKHRDSENNPIATPNSIISGFLLRSDVVSGWPGLLVDGYTIPPSVNDNNPEGDNPEGDNPDDGKLDDGSSDDGKPIEEHLHLLRMDRLSPNVLLCLFNGEIDSVDIHQKPELLHFGLDRKDDTAFCKPLKAKDGKRLDVTLDAIPWYDQDIRTVNISQLQSDIQNKLKEANITFSNFTTAQFALEMIEGVEKVRFKKMTNQQ